MKVKDLILASPLLKKAKLTKMDDADKFIVIKAVRAIQKVINEYEELADAAQEKFKGENHEEMVKKAIDWNERHPKGEDIPADERAEFTKLNGYFANLNRLMNKFRSEEAEKDVTCDYPNLKEEAFANLISSNDFTVEEIIALQNVLM